MLRWYLLISGLSAKWQQINFLKWRWGKLESFKQNMWTISHNGINNGFHRFKKPSQLGGAYYQRFAYKLVDIFLECMLSGLPWSLPATLLMMCLVLRRKEYSKYADFPCQKTSSTGVGPLSKHALMYLIIMIRTDTFLQNKCIPVLLLRHTNKAQWCSATIGINAGEASPSPQKYYRTYHTGTEH